MKRLSLSLLLSSSLFSVACSAEAIDSGPGGTPERGIGKADGLFGSCFDEGEATCGGPAAEGNCWCDDACTNWGDCCADKADACGGEEPPPAPVLCMGDNDCGDGQVCDHTECLSACTDDSLVCPAVCMGQCVDTEPEPECGAPDAYVDVDGEALFADPSAFVGQQIAIAGAARIGFPICTQLACSPDMPCCNACGAGLEMDIGEGQLEMSGLGCGGNDCDVLSNCDYDDGEEFVAWGTLEESFGLLHLQVDGSCAPEPEPVDECDCDEGELCIPLCPVCAAGSPPEACQCTTTCVAGPDEPPTFCGDDSDCGADEVCDPSLCIPSCPFCLDCNAACVPA